MYNIGDRIAHPMHGAGIIDSIVERRVNGVTRNYYLMCLRGGMTVMIPTENCEAIGVRPVIEACNAKSIIDTIPSLEIEMDANWNRRFRENMQKIKSGDLIEVARVIKGLLAREAERGLSSGERKMLHSAKQILISEIVLSRNSSYEEVENELKEAFA